MDGQEVIDVINRLEFFSDFPDEAKNDIASISSITSHSKDDLIIREGEVGDSLYLLLEGSLKIYKNKTLVGKAEKEGTLLGEIGFTSDTHLRSAMVVAQDNTSLLSFNTKLLKDILGINSPSIILTCLMKIARNNISKIESTNLKIAELVEKRHHLKELLKPII